MDKETLKRLIVESQEAELPALVERDLKLPRAVAKVIAVSGVRRSGKTCLLLALVRHLRSEGIPAERIAYLSFDDPRLLPAAARDCELVREAFDEVSSVSGPGRRYLLLDEVQQIDDWELGVRRLQDTREFHLVVTGSSSKLLGRDFATSLRGRSLTFELLPFSAREVLRARGIEVTPRTAYSRRRAAVQRCIRDYFAYGGFPEVALADDPVLKLRILKEYVETMFLRDLIERNRVRNPPLMRELLKFLVANVANRFSLNAYWKWSRTSYPVIKRTLIAYVNHLEDSGLIFLVRKYSVSLREQNLQPRKAYVVDNGLRAVYGFAFSPDRGRVLENSVYLALRVRQVESPLMGVYYWQNGRDREVDFVVTEAGKVRALLQVSADPREFGVRERELNPLATAMRQFKLREARVITEDYEAEERTAEGRIRFVPFWKWVHEPNRTLPRTSS